jgi:hypothetical protein
MAEVGSKAILPDLELMLFELEPGARVNRAFAESMDILGELESKSESEFVANLEHSMIEDVVRILRSLRRKWLWPHFGPHAR